jgi:hypothetical protein
LEKWSNELLDEEAYEDALRVKKLFLRVIGRVFS